MAEIVSIVYKPKRSSAKARYARVPLETATLLAGHGIDGDLKGGHPKRHLNIMSSETLDALHDEGFLTAPGQMGEQIVIRGLDVNALEPGDQLAIGDGAVVEIVAPRTGCDKFELVQGKLRTDAAQRMGIMAIVVQGGKIRVGSPVAVLQKA